MNRFIYGVISILIFLTILARFACEKFQCIKDFIQSNCTEYPPDWNLRSGIDETGLILLATLLSFIVLFYKDIEFTDFMRKLGISIFGLSLDELENDILTYERSKSIENQIDTKHTETMQNIIDKSSNNDERLSLISIEIEKAIKEIYMQVQNTNEMPISLEKIIEKLLIQIRN
jgi:hypothetical protein